jgi:hypothetical protein
MVIFVGVCSMDDLTEGASQADISRVRFFRQVETSYRQGALNNLSLVCKTPDRANQMMCNLVIHKATGKQNINRFISGAPKSATDVRWLWYWDKLLFQEDSEKAMMLFPGGFALSYIDELFDSVPKSSGGALNSLLLIYSSADGFYAEGITERFKVFFKGEGGPRRLYDEWTTIRRYPVAISKIAMVLDQENHKEKERIVNEACRNREASEYCREIRKVFLGRE